MRALLLMLGLSFLAATASADVYVEITTDGDTPDGLVDYGIVFGWPYDLDVYVWGTGADNVLRQAFFDIGPTEGEWQLDALGAVNPGGQFAGPNSPGTLDYPGIAGVQLFSMDGVPLPQTPASALLIYDNFVGAAWSAFALLDVIPTAFYTDTVPVVHAIGVRETPEPASGILLVAWALALRAGRK